jgi:bacteriorhodopsin
MVFSYLDLNGLRSLGSRSAETGHERFVSGSFHFLGAIAMLWKPQRKSLRRKVRYLSGGIR